MESWNWEQLFTRNPEEEVAPSESLQGKTLREKIEFKREVVEEKKVKILRKVTSLSDSYVDQTSSGSEFSSKSLMFLLSLVDQSSREVQGQVLNLGFCPG